MKKVAVLFFAGLLSAALAAEEKNEGSGNIKKIGNAAPAGVPVKEIDVSAKKYEFNPATIEVPVNTLLRMNLKATDREHGFELKSVKDSCVKFDPKVSATLEFYADKAGEYEFRCCKRCGLGHGKMKGKLVVK
jgi:cytochrome c oxidase subunit 2